MATTTTITTATRPKSAERPSSARSIQGSTRQKLRHPNARHIYAIEPNRFDENDGRQSRPLDVWTIKLSKVNPAMNNVKDSTNIQTENLDDPLVNQSLNQLVFSKIQQNFVEVSFSPRDQIESSKVFIRCIFLRVGEIDTLNERYYAEILFEASWEEPALKGVTNRSFDPSVFWTPELELMNGIGDLQDEILYTIYHNKQGVATVTEHHKLKGTLWERMELQHFPADVQELSLVITTSRTDKEMKFFKNSRRPSGVNRRVFTDEQEWYLFEHVDTEITSQIDEYLDDGNNHSVVICSCHAARKYGYFFWNAYFLIFLITSASFTTFPIPLNNIHGRVQIGCTLLLTSITFRWLCNKSLPTISYLTAVDVYAIGSLFSLCVLNIYHGVIGYVDYYTSTNRTGSTTVSSSDPTNIVIDRWALVCYTIIFFAYQIGTIIWMFMVPLKKRREMFRKDRQNRLQLAKRYNNARATFIDVIRGAKKTMNENNHSIITNVDL